MNINNPTSFSPPDLTLSTSNSSGSAGALRADDTILVYDATVPDAITFGQSGAAGSAAVSARRDHAHAMVANPTTTAAVRCGHNANQTIDNTTTTLLAFNTEKYDTDGMHDTSTNNGRITAQTDGYYIISASCTWDDEGTNYRNHLVYFNGSTLIARQIWNASSGVEWASMINTHYALDADDYIEFKVYQNSGGARTITGNTEYSPIFSAMKVTG